jgi:putative transcriptional regulator
MKSTRRPQTRTRSPILEAVHEGGKDLHQMGFIDKRRMAEFDALCLSPVPKYTRSRIVALRRRLQLSQAVMASVLNTSVSTVRKWEQGDKQPSGPSLKLLDLLDRKGLEAVL